MEKVDFVSLDGEQKVWLTKVWDYIKSHGEIPDYKTIRLELGDKISKEFRSNKIDERLLRDNLKIQLLGVLSLCDGDTTYFSPLNKALEGIKNSILNNSNVAFKFEIGRLSEKYSLEENYCRVAISLFFETGAFLNSSDQSNSGKFGLTTFSVNLNSPLVLEQWYQFINVENSLNEYIDQHRQWDIEKKERIRKQQERSFNDVSFDLLKEKVQAYKGEFNLIEIESLNTKIDEVLQKLDEVGAGQEIIFDEIDSLKAKSLRFTKKDFGLLLIGQLATYGQGVLDQKTIQYIIEKILGTEGRLLLP